MSQYTQSSRSSRTEHPAQGGNSRSIGDLVTASRAWTIDSDEEPAFRASSITPTRSVRQAEAAPSGHTRSSRQSRRVSNDSNFPVRIRSPPPGRNPADGALSFREYLYSDPTGPRLSPVEADRMISQHLTYEEVLHGECKSVYERSVAAQSQTAKNKSGRRAAPWRPVAPRPPEAYIESVYSSNAPPSAYGAGCVPLDAPSGTSRISTWIDDVGESRQSTEAEVEC